MNSERLDDKVNLTSESSPLQRKTKGVFFIEDVEKDARLNLHKD